MRVNVRTILAVSGLLFALCACGQGVPSSSQSDVQATEGSVMLQANTPSAPITARADLNEQGNMELALGDWVLRLSAAQCESWIENVKMCGSGVQLALAGLGGVQQTLSLEGLYLSNKSTAYRGSLAGDYREGGYSFVFGDLDGDGHDDLMVWTGREGGYGAASYDVFLFDAGSRQFARHEQLTELMLGATAPYAVDEGTLKLDFKDGCCLHIADRYVLENREPILIERITKDSSTPDQVKTTIERRINGHLQEVPMP